MIIECPECGTKNTTDKPTQPGKRYRCGKCGASITILQAGETRGIPRGFSQKIARSETTNLARENTSGQGSSAVVPNEIMGWNWGAFLLNWLWSMDNRVWIGLLCFIPYVGIIMSIVLGMKGNEWAWQNKKWESIEHFKRTQATWTKWGVILFLVPFALFFWLTALLSC